MNRDEYLEDGARQDRSYDQTTPGPGLMPDITPSLIGVPATSGFTPPVNPVFNPANFREGVTSGVTLHGYHVEATDGQIGKVATENDPTDTTHLTVDTGPWIFGRTVLVPAGSVNHIDHEARIVYLDRTKEQVKGSPELGAEEMADPDARERVNDYYRGTYDQADAE